MTLKSVLITLSCFALLLIVVTFYVVFYSGGGTYVVSSVLGGPNAALFSSSTASTTGAMASSTTSSTLAIASSSPSGMTIDATPITWTQGNEKLSVVGAMLSGSQLTLGVQVTMDSVGECVPLTLRMIADEQGDLSPPVTQQFTFPDTGSCNGTPGETYSAQPIVFALTDPVAFPVILTTGGAANTLFEVVQNPDGSLTAQLPPQSD